MPTTSRLNSRKPKPSTPVWLLKPMPQPLNPQKWWRKPSQRAQDPHKHLLLPRRKMKLMPRKRHLRHPRSLRSLPSPSTVLLRRPSYQISTIVHCDFDASHTYKPCQIKQFIALEEKWEFLNEGSNRCVRKLLQAYLGEIQTTKCQCLGIVHAPAHLAGEMTVWT